MAVIQISKIQVRRGQEGTTGIPQLAPGEFGWAEDTEHLYIGKRISEGAVDDKNSRILTTNDLNNVFSLLGNASTLTNNVPQIYRGGPTGNYPWIASTTTTIQTKLDNHVSLTDFGLTVTDDTGTVDITDIFRKAVNTLFANATAPLDYTEPFRKLMIPAGSYVISDTIELPPFACIVGEGPNITTLILNNATTSMFQTVAVDLQTRQKINYYYTDPVSGNTMVSTKNLPRHIKIADMTMMYKTSSLTATTVALLALDNAKDIVVDNCIFKTDSTSSRQTTYGTGIRVQTSAVNDNTGDINYSENIQIINCRFDSFRRGVQMIGPTVRPIIQNCVFRWLDRGIICNALSVDVTGPLYGLFTGNKFDRITREGIIVVQNNPGDLPSNNISSNNTFVNVGNGTNSDDFITYGPQANYFSVLSQTATTVPPQPAPSKNATFNVIQSNQGYAVYPDFANYGAGYSTLTNSKLVIPGNLIGGSPGINNINVTVTSTTGTGQIYSFTYTGTSTSFVFPTPVINFQAPGNKTVDDYFNRRVYAKTKFNGVSSVNIVNSGTFSANSTTIKLNFSDTEIGNINAQAQATLSSTVNGHITSITMQNAGYGYQQVPTVGIDPTTPGLVITTLAALTPVLYNVSSQFYYNPLVAGSVSIKDPVTYTATIFKSTVAGPVTTSIQAGLATFGSMAQINYSLSNSHLSRKGQMIVNISADGYASITDNYNYSDTLLLVSQGSISSTAQSDVNVFAVDTALPQNAIFTSTNVNPADGIWYVTSSNPASPYYNQSGFLLSAVSVGSIRIFQVDSASPAINFKNTVGGQPDTWSLLRSDSPDINFDTVTQASKNYVTLTCQNLSLYTDCLFEYQVDILQ
jgi:hypothetical protein